MEVINNGDGNCNAVNLFTQTAQWGGFMAGREALIRGHKTRYFTWRLHMRKNQAQTPDKDAFRGYFAHGEIDVLPCCVLLTHL